MSGTYAADTHSEEDTMTNSRLAPTTLRRSDDPGCCGGGTGEGTCC